MFRHFVPFSVGFDFRATSNFVTDPAGDTFVLSDTYPTVRGGATFGWANTGAGQNSRNRSAAIDPRLAGLNFNASGTDTFRVNLPAAGTYQINAAFGDATNAQTITAAFLDNATTFASTTATPVAAGAFLDATFVSRTAANWPSQNVSIRNTFRSTIFIVSVGVNAPITHLHVTRLS